MRTECLVLLTTGLTSCLAQKWTYQGCYLDNPSKRTLTHYASTNNDVQTTELCTTYCGSKGFDWSGLEYGAECFCDYQLSGATQEPDTDCSMPCKGNSSQICGNGNRLSVYSNGNTFVAPITNPGPEGWISLGCYTDSTSSRSLRDEQSISAGSNAMTVSECTTACKSGGYSLAGLEYGKECFCDSKIQSGGAKADIGCDMPCAGNSTEICGGSSRLNVYQITALPTMNPGSNSLPAGWNALGCFTDSTSARSLSNGVEVQGGSSNMTIRGCLSACAGRGFAYAGLEYAQECFCGNEVRNAGTCASDQSTCNMSCRGNRAEICGGPDRLNIFSAGSNSNVVNCSAGGSTSSSTTVASSTSTSSSATSSSNVETTTSTSLSSSSSSTSTASSLASSSSSSAPNSSSESAITSTSSVSSSSSTTTSSITTSSAPASTVCPDFWSAVVSDLSSSMRTNGQCNNISRAAIRYAFHDSATYSNKLPFYEPAAGGADGSLLLSSTEINRVDSEGLHDYHAVLTSKFNSYKAAGYSIGAADLIQIAGAVGVLACPGGRTGRVFVGRKDTAQAAPDGLLPQAFGPGSDHDTIMQLFADKGFVARDLAALLGAHSTSIANFQSRFGIPAGTPQDTTPGLWDVAYYNETYFPPPGIGRFDSDINLSKNESRSAVGFQFKSFVGRPAQWGASFSSAYSALSLLGIPQSVRNNMQDCTVVVNRAFG
ncbi:putative hem peroxidase, carbohydrate-binding WSC, hem peroxidase superfamily [Septoria linicola]|nr:putative hem peroxidase, carbohydrate-binding WSC, hem peroxidase superfamily [Septoria linicola]